MPLPTRPTSTRRRRRNSSGAGRQAGSLLLSVAPRDPHSESPKCACAGNNPRAAPRYEGTLAGISAPRNPDFNEADLFDKPSDIKNLYPPLTSTQVDEVDATYRTRAEALLGVDDLVQIKSTR